MQPGASSAQLNEAPADEPMRAALATSATSLSAGRAAAGVERRRRCGQQRPRPLGRQRPRRPVCTAGAQPEAAVG
jgi:hypothetical protein